MGGLISTNLTIAHSDAAFSSAPTSDNTESIMPSTSVSIEPPTPSVLLSSQYNLLFEQVARADPSAVQTLSQMTADSSNHSSLLDQQLVPALIAGLKVSREGGHNDQPVQLAILRILADLVEHNPSHTRLSASALSEALCPLISDFTQKSVEPWGHWLKRQFSFSSEVSLPSSEQSTFYHTLDLLQQSKVTTADLESGIIHHTLRCVANMAQHSHLHLSIISTSLLSHLCQFLWNVHHYPASLPSGAHYHSDTLRFLTISVSALAKSAPNEVINNSAHIPIIALCIQPTDPVIQSYAAGGIKNMARHPTSDLKDRWRVHRELVVSGVAEALAASMQAQALPQTKSFAITAFSELMTTGHTKAMVIRKRLKPAFGPFAASMMDTKTTVHLAICRAIGKIFGDDNIDKFGCVGGDLANCVAEKSGMFIKKAFAQHDLAAAKAIRALCAIETVAHRMVEKGLIEMLRGEMKLARGEYWEECTTVLATLAKWPEHQQRIVQSGFLREVLQRPCLERDGLRTAAFLANMARDEEYRVEIAHGGLRVLLMSVTSKIDESVREGARGLYNLSLGGFSKAIVSQGGAIIPLIRAAKCSDQTACRLAIGALAEITETAEIATKLVEADVVKVLLDAAHRDNAVRRDVARCFAQMSLMPDVHGSLAKNGAAEWMADMISSNGGHEDHSGEIMQYSAIAICNISYSPGIARTVLLEKDIVRTLTALVASLGMTSPLVIHCAKQALANLRGVEKPSVFPTDGIAKQAHPA